MKLNIQLFAEGVVTIETEVNTSGIDKGIVAIENKLNNLRKKAEQPYEVDGVQITGGWNLSEEEQRYYDRLSSSLSQLQSQKNNLITQESEISQQTENIVEKTYEWINGVQTLNNGTQIVKKNTEETANSIKQMDFTNIQKSIDKVGNSVTKVTKKVGRWALAIFGIRSAYMFVRQAMSTLTQYDDQLAINVQYLRYLLANSLKPVIEYIVNLAYQLLNVVRSIIATITGYDIFAKASTKEFNKQQKAMGGTLKNAKELKKTLAGFDEMNILEDNTSTAGGGAGGGASVLEPNFDKIEAPKWLDNILPILAGVVTFLTLIKNGIKGIKALGIGIAVTGLLNTIKAVKDYIKDPTFNNFVKILEGIATTVAGVAIAFEAWPVAIGAALALGVIIIVKNLDKIKKLFEKFETWLDTNFLGKLRELFGPLGDILYAPIKYFYEFATNTFTTFYGGIKQWVTGIMKIFQGDLWGGIKNIFGGLLDIMTAPLQGFVKAVKNVWGQIKDSLSYWKTKFKETGGDIKEFLLRPVNTLIDALNKLITGVNKIKINIPNWVPGIGGKKWGFNIPKIPKLAKGGIVNMPGRGIPYGGATIAEKAPEGIVPLTDTQQMALLGEAIGRFVRIDNVIDVNMDSRKIKRILATSDSRDRMVGNG